MDAPREAARVATQRRDEVRCRQRGRCPCVPSESDEFEEGQATQHARGQKAVHLVRVRVGVGVRVRVRPLSMPEASRQCTFTLVR